MHGGQWVKLWGVNCHYLRLAAVLRAERGMIIFGTGLKSMSMNGPKDIFKEILISAETSCVLKIKLKNEKNPVITAVDKVLRNRIVLKPTCLYGYKLKTRTIALADIEKVTRYKTTFNNPQFTKLRFVRNNIGVIRNGLAAMG
jgi:hypothetical protein